MALEGEFRLRMSNDGNLPARMNLVPGAVATTNASLVARGMAAFANMPLRDAEQLYARAMAYSLGADGLEQSHELAEPLFLEAAKLGHHGAQLEIFWYRHYFGDPAEAAMWLEKSVAGGYGPALRHLAESMDEPEIADHLGNGPYRSAQLYRDALAWFEARAHSGEASSQYELAMMHRSARAPTDEPSQAIKWMTEAAKQDDVSACLRLGEWLLEANEPARDPQGAVRWLARAGELGNAYGYRLLGDLFLRGHLGGSDSAPRMMEPDPAKAVGWYERQIELERKRGSFLGTYALARKYLLGDELEQNTGLAETMLTEAARTGHLDSLRLLAREHLAGTRLGRNVERALELLNLAQAPGGWAKADDQFRIGRIYELEVDGAPRWAEALAWYRKSAANAGYLAQKALGDLYSQGRGVTLDYVQAYQWYVLAMVRTHGKRGIAKWHAEARDARDAIAPRMTAAQIGQARDLARSFVMDLMEVLDPSDRELAMEGLARAT